MFKLFTLEGATKMIPIVDERLHELQSAVDEFQRAQAEVRDLPSGSAEILNARQEFAFLVRAVHDARREVERLGVQVSDVATGVVEFPSRVHGEVVHLVWEPGREAITHYHRLTGDDAPRPLERPEGGASGEALDASEG